jgi:hypothetical protein
VRMVEPRVDWMVVSRAGSMVDTTVAWKAASMEQLKAVNWVGS